MKPFRFRIAFTMIEMLIVLAIAGVLGAIAVMNFQVTQTRAKVSQARADMRSMRIALEAYRVDNKEYVSDTGNEETDWAHLTTPVAYLAAIPRTMWTYGPFYSNTYRYYSGGISNNVADIRLGSYFRRHVYAIDCAGPSRVSTFSFSDVCQWDHSFTTTTVTFNEAPSLWYHLYDPTNGVNSVGDFVATMKKQYN